MHWVTKMKQEIFEEIARAYLSSTAAHIKDNSNEVGLVLNEDSLAAKKLMLLLVFGMKLAKTKSVLFKHRMHINKNAQIVESEMGRRLLDTLLNVDFDELRSHFPKHVFNPKLDQLISMIEELDLVEIAKSPKWRIDPVAEQELFERLNGFADAYRAEVNTKAFKSKEKNYLRRSKKNEKELRRLIDAVFLFPKVMVIRIDLSYKEHHKSIHGHEKELTVAEVRDHREKLLKQLSRRFKDSLISYAWKLEFGLKKGYHHHCFFFFDGTKIRQDVTVGKIIGDAWEQYATEGLGRYYNCNGKKENYKNVCVGIFKRGDFEVIRLLKDVVATYMTKVDLFMHFDYKHGFRTFGKGAIPKPKTNTVGRPKNRN